VSALRQLQQAFFGHLVGLPTDVISHIKPTAETSAEQRLHIYASGYRLRLKEAISTDYERLHGYLGDELFEQLMDGYIDKHHSHHPNLRYYSQYMPAFLADQAPFSEHPEIVEIARIEHAFNFSFDAANCATIGLERLGELAPDNWPSMQLQLHPSTQLISCNYNSFQIWKAISEGQTPPRLEQESTTWLVWRKDLISQYRALSEAEAHTVELALSGANFSDICEALLNYYNEEQTPQQAVIYLQSWIKDMMVCELQVF
jgi:hypothetical protein